MTARVGGVGFSVANPFWNMPLQEVPAAYPEVTAQVTAQVAAQVIVFCREPHCSAEIRAHLGLRHWKTFQTNYLTPMLRAGLMERTIPERPTSRLQKYRVSDGAKAWLEGVMARAGRQ